MQTAISYHPVGENSFNMKYKIGMFDQYLFMKEGIPTSYLKTIVFIMARIPH